MIDNHANASPNHNASGFEIYTSPGVTKADEFLFKITEQEIESIKTRSIQYFGVDLSERIIKGLALHDLRELSQLSCQPKLVSNYCIKNIDRARKTEVLIVLDLQCTEKERLSPNKYSECYALDNFLFLEGNYTTPDFIDLLSRDRFIDQKLDF